MGKNGVQITEYCCILSLLQLQRIRYVQDFHVIVKAIRSLYREVASYIHIGYENEALAILLIRIFIISVKAKFIVCA